MESREGCKLGSHCDYSHATIVEKHSQELQNYKCISCKDTWEDRSCVVEYNIKSLKTYFCLNCDEWVRNKSHLFNEDWTLLDDAGFLRRDI